MKLDQARLLIAAGGITGATVRPQTPVEGGAWYVVFSLSYLAGNVDDAVLSAARGGVRTFKELGSAASLLRQLGLREAIVQLV